MLKLFVISDLHCKHLGENSPEDDNFQLYSNKLRNPINKHPVSALLKFIKQEQLKCDYLVCPGDLTDKIDIQGLISGYNFIEEISQALRVKNKFISTGNHDYDPKKMHKGHSDLFHITRNFAKKYPTESDKLNSSYWEKDFYVYEDDKIILVNLNSSSGIDGRATRISDTTFEKLEDEVIKMKKNKYKIFVCHHHPTKFSNYSIEYKDEDTIDNGDKLLQLLSRNEFNILIHGHKHVPRVENLYNVNILCSGSFSCLKNILPTSGKTLFHIIEIKSESTPSNFKSIVKTYENSMTTGWRFALDPKFFPPITSFGIKSDIDKLVNDISSMMTGSLLTWEDALSNFPELQYLSPIQQNLLVEKLNDVDVRVYNENYAPIPSALIKK